VTTGSGPNTRSKFRLNELVSLLEVNCTSKDELRYPLLLPDFLASSQDAYSMHTLHGIGFIEGFVHCCKTSLAWRLFTGLGICTLYCGSDLKTVLWIAGFKFDMMCVLPQLMSGIPESLQQEITKFMTAGVFNLMLH
jgi:hypothetical protein